MIERDTEATLSRLGEDHETGGAFAGTIKQTDTCQPERLEIISYIPAGPQTRCSPTHIELDEEFLVAGIRWLQIINPDVRVLGMHHRHPGRQSSCSEVDYEADRKAAQAVGHDLLFAITTVENPVSHPLAIRVGRLRIDFYVLGPSTAFKYHQIKPEVTENSPLPLPGSGVQLALRRGPALTHDVAALRRIPGLQSIKVGTLNGPDINGVIVQAVDNARRATYSIVHKPDYSMVVQVRKDSADYELTGPWNHPSMANFVWYSEIILSARRACLPTLDRAHPLASPRCSTAWWLTDPRRLALETKAVKQRYPNNAQLYKKNGFLVWTVKIQVEARPFELLVYYDHHHPYNPPWVYNSKKLPSSPHTCNDRRYICWTPRTNSPWSVNDTAVTAILGAQRFILALMIHQTTGKWPQNADHDQP